MPTYVPSVNSDVCLLQVQSMKVQLPHVLAAIVLALNARRRLPVRRVGRNLDGLRLLHQQLGVEVVASGVRPSRLPEPPEAFFVEPQRLRP